MLKILDRYIIGKYLATFFFALLICTMVSMAIDFSDKVQDFIEKPCTAWEIIFHYYVGFVAFMAGMLLPLYTLIAVVFFTSRFAFNSEILAILNAGVSFSRLMRPYLIAGGAVTLLHLAMNHTLVPQANKMRLKFERTYVYSNKEKTKSSKIHFMLSPDSKLYIESWDKNSKMARNLRIEKFTDNRLSSMLFATMAQWQDEPQKWRLSQYYFRTFNGLKETIDYHNSGTLDTTLNLAPADFSWFEEQNLEMTTSELSAAIERDKIRGVGNTKGYQIERLRRTAEPFTSLILTIIGLALAGRKVRGGMGLHLALGVGIGAFYILLSKFSITLAASGSMPIALGIWTPNILFSIVAAYLVLKAQK